MRLFAGLVLTMTCGLVRGEVSEPPASLATTLRPGAFDELCLRLGAGTSVRYAFDAGGPTDFNIHWHRGDDVLFPVKRDGVARLEGRFRPEQAQIYCLMWTNRGAKDVTLRAKVEHAD